MQGKEKLLLPVAATPLFSVGLIEGLLEFQQGCKQ
jgi:hypothetical protein